ncbi:MAG: dUTP diphosphatase [Thermodesulfobacteriota bacterium]|nr:dUTP diphosphatase [Thermodesulfobacteriota bacterium]
MILKVKKLTKDAIIPSYAHPGDAGLDLFSVEDALLNPGESTSIKTGIAIELPERTEAQIRPKSGLALKNQITVLNSPGTIDVGYRGEIIVILINHGKNAFTIAKGMKIAQMVISPLLMLDTVEVQELAETKRGTGGFGSTGN